MQPPHGCHKCFVCDKPLQLVSLKGAQCILKPHQHTSQYQHEISTCCHVATTTPVPFKSKNTSHAPHLKEAGKHTANVSNELFIGSGQHRKKNSTGVNAVTLRSSALHGRALSRLHAMRTRIHLRQRWPMSLCVLRMRQGREGQLAPGWWRSRVV